MRAQPFISILGKVIAFPDPNLARPDGLVALGGDLSTDRLLQGYRRGIFPWSIDPITWWSPDPRSIFELDAIHIPRRVAQIMRQKKFELSFDSAFEDVICRCAAPARGREETWISAPFIQAYKTLHRQGHAHSVEVWEKGELVGGLYGVAIGGFFAGESMFHTSSNASKIALFHLLRHLHARGFILFDTQVSTPHTRSLGAIDIPRHEYLQRLKKALTLSPQFQPL